MSGFINIWDIDKKAILVSISPSSKSDTKRSKISHRRGAAIIFIELLGNKANRLISADNYVYLEL